MVNHELVVFEARDSDPRISKCQTANTVLEEKLKDDGTG